MMRDRASGFTLVEILIALGILGIGLFVGLQGIFAALTLHDSTVEAVVERELFTLAMGQAEVEVAQENLTGDGDFGARYPDFSYAFEATKLGEEENQDVQLYEVKVTVYGPGEPRTMTLLVYRNTGDETYASGGGTAGGGAASGGSR